MFILSCNYDDLPLLYYCCIAICDQFNYFTRKKIKLHTIGKNLIKETRGRGVLRESLEAIMTLTGPATKLTKYNILVTTRTARDKSPNFIEDMGGE